MLYINKCVLRDACPLRTPMSRWDNEEFRGSACRTPRSLKVPGVEEAGRAPKYGRLIDPGSELPPF